MSAPPAIPAKRRHKKNQRNDEGRLQAKNPIVARTIIERRTTFTDTRFAVIFAATAPVKYPNRFAAPRYAALAAENQCAATMAGIKGV